MALRLKGGAVFLHVPKTGGSWVNGVLRELGLVEAEVARRHAGLYEAVSGETFRSGYAAVRHFTSRYVKRSLRQWSEPAPYTFCFVRHPLKWYESYWRFMKGNGWYEWGPASSPYNWVPMAPLNGIRDDDFNQYIRKVLTVWPGYVSALYGSYTKPRVDFIGKTERLADDLIIVLDRLGLKYDEQFIRNYKKQNVSATPESAAVWDDDVRRLATTLEMPALMQYDYLDGDAAPDGVRIPAAAHPSLYRP